MSSFRAFFSGLLHRFVCLWLVIKNIFSRSKKSNSDFESCQNDIQDKDPLEFSLEEFAAAKALARSNDPFLTIAPLKYRPPPVRRQLAVLEAIRRDGSLPYDENAEIRRNEINFGPPSAGLEALPFFNVKDFLEESYSNPASDMEDLSLSVDLTEQHLHRDSVTTEASGSRLSESSSASIYEDVTDTYEPYISHEPPVSTALPDWRQADESYWKTEVALGLSKLKDSRAEHDEISSTHSSRSSTRRLSQSSQIKEICEWRSDFGPQPRVKTPPPVAEYKLAHSFQFPRSRSSVP